MSDDVEAIRSSDFDDLQGNILSAYRLPYGAFLVVRIENPQRGREWLNALFERLPVTTARGQERPLTRACNLAFTHAGLRQVEAPDWVLGSVPPDFREGMYNRADRLRDKGENHPEKWEDGLNQPDGGHVMLMLRAARPSERHTVLTEALQLIRDHELPPPHEEVSNPLPPRPGEAQRCGGGEREHFGFADGCSQPAIEGTPAAEHDSYPPPLKAGEFFLGYRDEDETIPGNARFFRNGSFMVFRKLEQRVAAFEEVLARHAGPLRRDELAAKIIGRWQNGEPLVEDHKDRYSRDRRDLNSFRYGSPLNFPKGDEPAAAAQPEDPYGFRCPLGAHIRRAFPRDGLVGGERRTRRHRIMRRGMPYDNRRHRSSGDDSGRGLLFICFQASIARQFETVHGWCMDGNLFDVPGEPDFLLGPSSATMTIQRTGEPLILTRTDPLVVTRGGGYFFYPSLTALTAIATGDYSGLEEPVCRRRTAFRA